MIFSPDLQLIKIKEKRHETPKIFSYSQMTLSPNLFYNSCVLEIKRYHTNTNFVEFFFFNLQLRHHIDMI